MIESLLLHMEGIVLKKESSTTSSQDSACVGVRKKVCKSLRLSSEMIAKMNLKPGRNEIQFSVTTAFQGTSRCSCSIYLWLHTDKVSKSNNQVIILTLTVLGCDIRYRWHHH